MNKRILVIAWPEPGHLLGVAGLAKALQARGVHVTIASTNDLAEATERAGFDFSDLLGQLWQVREIWADAARGDKGALGLTRIRQRRRDLGSFYAAWATATRDLIRALRPDAILYDDLLPFCAPLAHELAIPCFQYPIDLPKRYDLQTFPGFDARIPQPTFAGRLQVRAAWSRLWLRSWRDRAVMEALCIGLTFGPTHENLRWLLRVLCQQTGYPFERFRFDTSHVPLADVPTLVLAPRTLDFDRERTENIEWIGHYILHARAPEPDYQLPPGDGPLVYCSFGTQTASVPRAAEFYQMVIDAIAAIPGLRLALACGTQLEPADFQFDRDRTTVSQRLPQLKILPQARLAVMHGGFGTLKECAAFGVPMLAIPMRAEQPRAAALVELRQLGLMLKMEEVTTAAIGARVEAILRSESIASAVLTMRETFREAEKSDRGVALILSALGQS